MSEEILKALMHLFALIVKQDEGVTEAERKYIENFLTQQLSDEMVSEYIQLFDEYAGGEGTPLSAIGNQPTSVRDSVRIFGICKKINRTLNQQQKFVVMVRLFELVNADRNFSEQRMNIINTVSEVFKFSKEEFADIASFIKTEQIVDVNSRNMLVVSGDTSLCRECKSIRAEGFPGHLVFLHIQSADLIFLRIESREDVTLNGLNIRPDRTHLFASGSSLKLPRSRIIYYSDVLSRFIAETTPVKLSFQAEGITHRFANGEYALRNLNFSAAQGKMIGILGSSGTGKSTLLNILSGLSNPTEGRVLVNGIDLHRRQDQLKGVIGYVPQDDLLIEDLTIFQNLYYNARLCFRSKNKAEVTDLVNHTLQSLGLYEKRDLRVGSVLSKVISGGQRKRLNIALELIREPHILFVDEPTSGLSSRDSENVMDLLRELNLKGKLVFIVIHQPSSDLFKMFDNVIILDQGGYMVYCGNPVEAVIYFKTMADQINAGEGQCPSCGNVNPELIFNILETQVVDEFGRYTDKRKVSPAKWEERFMNHSSVPVTGRITEKPKSTLSLPSRMRQYLIFTVRDILSKLANRQYLLLTLTEAPVLGFILSYITRYIADPNSSIYIFRENENIPIYIFMSLIVALFIGLTISAEEIFRDRRILRREAFLNLSRNSYLLSKVSILFLLSAFQAFVFVIIANSILEVRGLFLEYWLAFFTTAAFANMLGLNISSSFNSAITIYIIIPLLVIPMMVLSGAMFSFDKLNRKVAGVGRVPVIAELLATKWTYEALMVTQFKDNRYEKKLYAAEQVESNAYFNTVEYIPYLRQVLNKAVSGLNREDDRPEIRNRLELLRNELSKIPGRVPAVEFAYLDSLSPDFFNPYIALETRKYLDRLFSYYEELLQRASLQKEAILDREDARNPRGFRNLRKTYHNISVEDVVKNIYERHNILEYKNELVRQYQPVFFNTEPKDFLDFRSHFFAPQKYFMGRYHGTFGFNLAIVWAMTVALYMFLYFELIRKTISFLGGLNPSKIIGGLHFGFI